MMMAVCMMAVYDGCVYTKGIYIYMHMHEKGIG